MNLAFQAGQLGDGRAILLGEYANSKGEHWELQLKGMESFLKVILTNNIFIYFLGFTKVVAGNCTHAPSLLYFLLEN